jgi:hypothetical protein
VVVNDESVLAVVMSEVVVLFSIAEAFEAGEETAAEQEEYEEDQHEEPHECIMFCFFMT